MLNASKWQHINATEYLQANTVYKLKVNWRATVCMAYHEFHALSYWTSMSWSINTCEIKVFADQYCESDHILGLDPMEVAYFLEVYCFSDTGFQCDCSPKQGCRS